MMKRYLSDPIQPFLNKKIVLLMGPRQVGKTTLAQSLKSNFAYYDYDIKKDVRVFLRNEWNREPELVIFDELHKMKKWKLWLKGIYDEGALKSQKFLVTGSARLDVAKKMGDSLAGRFFSFRLHPLDLKELKGQHSAQENYKKLLNLGGFPEPFFEGSEKYYQIWRKTHLDLILRQDLLSLESIRDIDGIEVLVQLLSERVQSCISINSLARDLDRDDKTIKRWLQVLENLYVVFKVPPKTKNIARGIKKSAKYYFYDLARVDGNEDAKLENLVALSLKKEIEFLQDTQGEQLELFYARTKDQKEIDFFIERKKKNPLLIEVKTSAGNVSANFNLLQKFFPQGKCIQLVKNLERNYVSKNNVKVTSALDFLESLSLEKEP
ncbi:MAG: ATP-binding protein [Pseudobdellovibrionaceae bacterium]